MTTNDYLNNLTGTVSSKDEAEDILNNYLQPFSEVIERFVPNNMTQERFNALVKLMSS